MAPMPLTGSTRRLAALALALLAAGGFTRGEDALPAREPGLLIVAPDLLAKSLDTFVAHKQRLLPTEVLTLERALAESDGADDPEKLKRSLHRAWRERGIHYVLLVGDADILPVRYMVLDRITPEAFDYAFYPSDLYYADLARKDGSFDDWNGRKDGFHGDYFGEVRGEKNKDDPVNFDAVDYVPEVALGRWPASTPEEAALIAAKSMRYEVGVLAGTKPGLRRAAFLGVGGWIDSRAALDRAAGALPAGWSAVKRYFKDAARDDGAPPPTKDEVMRLLGEGLGLIVHAGHGQDDQWEQAFSVSRLGRLQNADRLCVMLSVGCSTGRFATLPPYEPYVDVHDVEHAGTNAGEVFHQPPPPPAPYQAGRFNPTGLGEQSLRLGPQGAAAYIGCNTGSQPCAMTLLEGFTRALGASRAPRLGDLWRETIAYYHDRERLASLRPGRDWYPPSIFFQGMKFMVYGDPSLILPKPKTEPGGPAAPR